MRFLVGGFAASSGGSLSVVIPHSSFEPLHRSLAAVGSELLLRSSAVKIGAPFKES
jgi:hypothetical protein